MEESNIYQEGNGIVDAAITQSQYFHNVGEQIPVMQENNGNDFEIIREGHVPIVFANREFVNARTGKRRVGVSFDRYLKVNVDKFLIRGVDNGFDGIIAVTGLEGCLRREEKVYKCGRIIEIKDIKDNEFFTTKVFDFKTKTVIDSLAQKISTGEKEVFELELENGKKLQCTADHRFFIKDGTNIIEKRLKDLTENDEILQVDTGTNAVC